MITKKIMVVDDSKLITKFIKRTLIKENFEVETINFPGEILNYDFKTFLPDLFILDINMPEYDGFYILEYIKKNELLKNIKVLMCSTKFFDQDKNKAYKLGANDFLVKPFSNENLLIKINSLMEQENEK